MLQAKDLVSGAEKHLAGEPELRLRARRSVMEITYKVSDYFSSTLRHESVGTGTNSSDDEGIIGRARTGDSVEISQEGRTLQRILSGAQESNEETAYNRDKSNLMSYIDGDEAREDTRLAYNGVGSAADTAEDADDADARIKELQLQLREAMKNMQEARQALSDAQAKNIKEVKAMQQGEAPDMSGAGQQLVEQEVTAAQQQMVSAQAEVNSIQEQLQKALKEKSQSTGGSSGASGIAASAGGTWEPQGTNDYIGGNW